MSRMYSQALLLGAMVILTALLALFWAHPSRESLVTVGAVVIIALSLLLETVVPNRRHNAAKHGQEIAGDIASFMLIFGLLDALLKWAAPFLVLAIMPAPNHSIWPLYAQIIFVFGWIELAAWASHWAHHRYSSLWALHAMHHSPQHLYTLNNFRFHPLNHVINHLAMILPLLFIGISTDAILVYSVVTLPVLLLQHSNIDFDFGALNRVLNTNDLHRWHHSSAQHEGTKNLGRALVFWDQVFGTYLRPTVPSAPAQIGLFAQSAKFPAPRQFWAQLWWPFSRACCAQT